MARGTIYRRRIRVFTLAVIVYLDYKAVQQREKWIERSKCAALWERAHERNARRILNVIVKLEGLWVKLGQYLSTRADVLPEAYITVLKQLQDSLPPRSLNEVCKTIEKELGRSMDDLFQDFVKTPLATASIAQVHRATLLNGQDVVVKVQHDGIKAIILEDLKNAKSIVDWIAWAEPQYDFNPMIDEWCREAPRELDFNLEAENTRTVSKNLGVGKKRDGKMIESENMSASQVDILIPEVIQSTEKVLILEYMDGIRLNDNESLEAYGVNKLNIVEEITRAYAHQIYVDGFFNGDPHPGNFLVSKVPPHRPILLDFGLTKKLSGTMKHALAKMFLASAEGDHVALLSAFAEMGLKLRLDMPDQAMEVATLFFRSTTPASEALENVKSLSEQRTKNLKVIQEKMELSQKEVKRFNPIDAFPGDIVIFGRVINLLRGLSSSMNVRIIYRDIMRPFAESVLLGSISKGPTVDAQWVYDTPVHSDVEAKLRQLLVKLGNDQKFLEYSFVPSIFLLPGNHSQVATVPNFTSAILWSTVMTKNSHADNSFMVCAYKDGEVIIDTAAGVLGKYDPRPVLPDSLFPVFSTTKGIAAGMIHWLVDKGKINLEENIANIWPEFRSNGKDLIKVHHVLNHTSGLHNALADLNQENPLLVTDWNECLNRVAHAAPETEPGQQQLYHYLSFGWLCGGIIEHASGKKLQEILEEAFIHPLKIDGELYIGIPPGVESRLAALTVDMDDLQKLRSVGVQSDLPSTFQPESIIQTAATLPAFFNLLNIRRAIIPAANGHCSARALARYYATLVDGGVVPPPHSSSFKPPLGSHPHIPKPASHTIPKQKKGSRNRDGHAVSSSRTNAKSQNLTYLRDRFFKRNVDSDTRAILVDDGGSNGSSSLGDADGSRKNDVRIFSNPRVHDAFMGVGDYQNLVVPGKFGLGFRRIVSEDGALLGFGHSGMGGSTAFCDITNRFSIAVTLNKISMGTVTREIVEFVCSELNLPCPAGFSRFGAQGPDTTSHADRPLIN